MLPTSLHWFSPVGLRVPLSLVSSPRAAWRRMKVTLSLERRQYKMSNMGMNLSVVERSVLQASLRTSTLLMTFSPFLTITGASLPQVISTPFSTSFAVHPSPLSEASHSSTVRFGSFSFAMSNALLPSLPGSPFFTVTIVPPQFKS